MRSSDWSSDVCSSDLLLRRGVVVGILVVDRGELHLRPARLLHPEPDPVGLEAPLQHPLRLALLRRDEADDVLVQPLRRRLLLDRRDEAVLVFFAGDRLDLFDRLVDRSHQPFLPRSCRRPGRSTNGRTGYPTTPLRYLAAPFARLR